MAKAKDKKNARVVSGPSQPGMARHMGETLGRGIRTLVPVLALALAYAALAYQLWRPVYADRQAVLTRERILQPVLKARAKYPWITDAEWRRLAEQGVGAAGHSVFEAGLSAKVAAAYESSPWVESVGAVRLRYPASLWLDDVRIRAPFARLDGSDGICRVVDRKGFVLPMTAGDLAAPSALARASGKVEVASLKGVLCSPAAEGHAITDAEALEGLNLLDQVDEVLRRAASGFKPIRATRDAEGSWRISLNRGPEILWGCGSDERRPMGEATGQEKIELLARRLREVDPMQLRYIKLDGPGAPVMPR